MIFMRQIQTFNRAVLSLMLLTSSSWSQENSGPISISLGIAIQRALTSNRQLANSYQNADQSEFQVILNQGEFDLQILPTGDAGYVGGGRAGAGSTVSGGVEFYKKFELGTAISVQPLLIKAAHEFRSQLNMSINQPLLRGFGKLENLSALETAKFGQRSALRNLITAQISTVLRTIQSVYDVKRNEEVLVIDQASCKRLKQFLEAARRKEKIGLADSLDVYRAEMEYKQAENSLTISIDRLQDSKDALKDILALPLNLPIEVSVPIEHHPITLQLEESIAIGLQYRQEVLQAWEQVLENKRLSCVAEKRLKPDLNLILDFSSTGCNEAFTAAFCRRRVSTWGIGFSTSTDFDRTPDKIAYQQSQFAVSSAERAYWQARDNIVLEIKKAIRNILSSETKLKNLEEQVKTAQGGLYLAKIKYDRGLGNNFDVIQAEKSLQTAQVSQIAAVIDHILGEYKLLAALGILGTPEKLSICMGKTG
jgi:outer membrane protein